MKIYNLGSLNVDYVYDVPHFVRPAETISADRLSTFPGGKGLNQSVALARAGADVIHGGVIGKDGEFLKATLRSAGVDVSLIKSVDSPTGHAIIQVDPNGQNCIVIFHGANYLFDTGYIDEVLKDAGSGDLLLLQNEINNIAEIMKSAHKKGMTVAFNPSPFDKSISSLPLEYVGLWLLNEVEGEDLTGEKEPPKIINALSQRYPGSNVLLTLGEKGSMLKYNGDLFIQPAVPCDAVDTTAAGDTFTGYFISMLASGKDAQHALKAAATASSIAVSRKGASESIPELNEVLNNI